MSIVQTRGHSPPPLADAAAFERDDVTARAVVEPLLGAESLGREAVGAGLIQSYWGLLGKKLEASKGVPQARPQRPRTLSDAASLAVVTFPSSEPHG